MKIEDLKNNINELNDSFQLCMKELVTPVSSPIVNSISKNNFYQTKSKKVLLPTKKINRLY